MCIFSRTARLQYALFSIETLVLWNVIVTFIVQNYYISKYNFDSRPFTNNNCIRNGVIASRERFQIRFQWKIIELCSNTTMAIRVVIALWMILVIEIKNIMIVVRANNTVGLMMSQGQRDFLVEIIIFPRPLFFLVHKTSTAR